VDDGSLHLAPGPGFGVEIDEDALARKRIALGPH
jgi:L-alanine-DL-glutamate epimerase-like enolase superfamily enzyme